MADSNGRIGSRPNPEKGSLSELLGPADGGEALPPAAKSAGAGGTQEKQSRE